MPDLRILGIDPGTNALGYAILDIDSKKLVVRELNVYHLPRNASHQKKLHFIFTYLEKLIETYQPSQMAIEAPFYGKNVQSMLKLGRAQGVAIAAALTKKLLASEYSPKKIKVAITGNGNASKEQVAAMLDQIISNRIETSSLDATDALAAAVCHHFQKKNGRLEVPQYKDWSSYINANPHHLKKG
ncbi:MAG: crossover junction endodeoxyribonuclease RuvC [Saprospiraceae bacterium]|nr:crossover junction endodeoxyribonuclease RuvC [Saprospiraceae bacterium]